MSLSSSGHCARSAHSHIFLGFSKCGRYVLSYTSSSGDDDFSFYIYHLYWWEFNVHSKLKLVGPGWPFRQQGLSSSCIMQAVCKMAVMCQWGGPCGAADFLVQTGNFIWL